MGLIADWNNKTLDMFTRQENRLERSFYRALHELQRLRQERESNLASVLQPASVGQVPDLPSSETNNIQTLPSPNPVPDPIQEDTT